TEGAIRAGAIIDIVKVIESIPVPKYSIIMKVINIELKIENKVISELILIRLNFLFTLAP
ncbi:hypothetical protein ACFL53_05305, partial [Pseudomonadota bacterium]